MNINLNTVFSIDFDGIDHSDSPDYCDAHIVSAEIREADGTFREATEEEIEFLNDDSQFVYERLMDHLF